MKLTYDPNKDAANIAKHGLSLADAMLVFDAPDKLTLKSPKSDEARLMDVAVVAVAGVVLSSSSKVLRYKICPSGTQLRSRLPHSKQT